MEEYRIDGARAFVDMAICAKTVANAGGSAGGNPPRISRRWRTKRTRPRWPIRRRRRARRATARVGVPGRRHHVGVFGEEEEERDREEVLAAAAEAAKRVMEMQELIDEETDEKKESERDEEDK